MNDPLYALRAAAPTCPLLVEQEAMEPYLTDWRGIFRGKALCVARPGTTAEVAALVRESARLGLGIVPQGGNTGLAGGATPVGSSSQLVLSLGRMNRIRHIDRVGMTLEAEAGCVLQQAKDAATQQGRLLPIGFAAQGSAQIGGIIATNAGGINALRYGTVRQQVLGIEAVLADGSVVRRMGALRKDNAGYDWKQWLIGSEGTLGIVTAAVLRLVPQPRSQCCAFVSLATAGAAVQLLEQLQDTLGDSLSAFELMSGPSVRRVQALLGVPVPTSPAEWHVLVEIGDSAPAAEERLLAALEAPLEEGLIADAAVGDSLARAARMWSLREHITEAERMAGPSVKHDIAVAVSAVPAFLDSATQAVMALSPQLEVNAFGHVGDGNIHFNVIDTHRAVEPQRIWRTVHDVVARLDGSIAAEHGIGQYRTQEMLRLKDANEQQLMRRIKLALDPRSILNPGKVLPSGDFPMRPSASDSRREHHE